MYLPAEWAPQQAVQLTWPHAGTDFAPHLAAARKQFLAIAAAIAETTPLIVVAPEDDDDLEAGLDAAGVPADRRRLLRLPCNDIWARDLPRFADPFKKMRNGGPFCEAALSAMEGEGAQVLLSNDRRRLSECLFEGGMDFKDVAVWDPDGVPSNHFEFRSRLAPGDADDYTPLKQGVDPYYGSSRA